jgi:hypothetical protein
MTSGVLSRSETLDIRLLLILHGSKKVEKMLKAPRSPERMGWKPKDLQ